MNHYPNNDQPVRGQQQSSPFNNPYVTGQSQAAFSQSFTTPAVICMVLYCVLGLLGLIANIVYLLQAKKVKALTGTAPQGYGCLWALSAVVTIIPLIIERVGLLWFLLLPAGK